MRGVVVDPALPIGAPRAVEVEFACRRERLAGRGEVEVGSHAAGRGRRLPHAGGAGGNQAVHRERGGVGGPFDILRRGGSEGRRGQQQGAQRGGAGEKKRHGPSLGWPA